MLRFYTFRVCKNPKYQKEIYLPFKLARARVLQANETTAVGQTIARSLGKPTMCYISTLL